MYSNTKVPMRYPVVFSKICFIYIFLEKYSETKYVCTTKCTMCRYADIQIQIIQIIDNLTNQ